MEKILELVLESYGIAGLFLAFPFVICLILWGHIARISRDFKKEREAHQSATKVLNEKLVEAQMQRVTDAQQFAAKLMEMAVEQTGLAKETNHALARVGDMLSVTLGKVG